MKFIELKDIIISEKKSIEKTNRKHEINFFLTSEIR